VDVWTDNVGRLLSFQIATKPVREQKCSPVGARIAMQSDNQCELVIVA
jgi:hypothetical protein